MILYNHILMANPENGSRQETHGGITRLRAFMATLGAMGLGLAACANADEATKMAKQPEEPIRVATLEASELDKAVLSKIVTDYQKCVAEEVEVAEALDDPIEKAEFIVEGEEACQDSMDTAVRIAESKARMRGLTDSLIKQAKEEAGISGT